MTQQRNIEAQRRMVDAVNSGRLELLRELIAPAVVDHDPAEDQTPGPEGYIAFFSGLRHAFSDLKIEIKHMVADEHNVSIAYKMTGIHKGRFDIKLRALKPLTDAVRVLALDRGLHVTGTLERLAALAETDASVRDLRADLVAAHETFIRCRILFGRQDEERGRYIECAAMDRVETRRLVDAFDAVKALLTVVRVRYQLDALGLV